MRIQAVHAQGFCELPRRVIVDHHIAKGEGHGKIEWSIQSSVDAVTRDSTGKVGNDACVRIEAFADGLEIGIRGMQLGMKIMPERAIHIGKSVDSETVERSLLRPPQRVLNQILLDQR